MFAPRSEFHRKFSPLRGSVFTLEGLIATGKSTAGQSLADFLVGAGLDARFFPEYNNRDLLAQYISDMPRYAYAFQLFMLAKRIAIYQEAEAYARTGGIAIVDRSILGDMTFARMQRDAGFITEGEWAAYVAVMRQEIQLVPALNVYLDCSPRRAMARVARRGVGAEVDGYTLAYMERLAAAYEETLAGCETVQTLRLDWEGDLALIERPPTPGSVPDARSPPERLLPRSECDRILSLVLAALGLGPSV